MREKATQIRLSDLRVILIFSLFFLFVFSCATTNPPLSGVYKYRVSEGDTLEILAARFDTSPEKISKSNKVLASGIRVGDILYIRPGSKGMQSGPHRFIYANRENSNFLGEVNGKTDQKWNLVFNVSSKTLIAPTRSGLLFSSSMTYRENWQWPISGILRSQFGVKRGRRQHEGLDIAAKTGTPIYPASVGRVIFVGTKRGYGKVVVVEHEHYRTLYAHLSEHTSRVGNFLTLSDQLGLVGRTGNASGPHLHFEIRDPWGYSLDPLAFMNKIKKDHLISQVNLKH